jgi:hypothetical protein
VTPHPDVGFVACIEAGQLEEQALLLFESIRLHAGSFSDCSLYAVSPRAGYHISPAGRRRLDELGVHFIEEILNTESPRYGSANRVVAAAHIEDTTRHEIVVALDSDTLFLREPSSFMLPADVDAAARPVDMKGVSTTGSRDPFDAYWQELCRIGGVDYDEVPWRASFVDRQPIKANYNGGLVVVRSRLGILRRCADLLFASLREGLRPRRKSHRRRTGAGWVDPETGRYWGSSQVAMSLAIWGTTRRVRELPATYNYPLHLHDRVDEAVSRDVFPNLVHAHYHWTLARDSIAQNPLFAPSGPLRTGQRAWLRSTTPID